MRKLISFFSFIAIFLLSSSYFVAIAQDLPLSQKQWYELGVIGAPPDTSNYNGIVQQIANQTGLVNAAGNVCFATADAGCRILVALGGALGAVSLKAMDGTAINVANIGLETISANYFWNTTTGSFVALNGLTANNGLALPAAPWNLSMMMLYDGATADMAVNGPGTATQALRVTSASDDPAVASLAKNPWAKLDDDAAVNCVDITAGSVQFSLIATMPGWTEGDWVCMGADGNMAYILCGAAPVASLVTGVGFAFKVPSGASRCRRLVGPICAVIGTVAGGTLCFEHLDGDL